MQQETFYNVDSSSFPTTVLVLVFSDGGWR